MKLDEPRTNKEIKMRDWEQSFNSWASGPGKTEEDRCENAIRAIKSAISDSRKLQNRGVEVFLQGSYKNRVSARKDSDVDVGVMCTTIFGDYPQGMSQDDFGLTASDYTFTQFKSEVQEALVDKFGWESVQRGNKAFDIKSNSQRVEADVAPFFEHRQYQISGSYTSGAELRSDDGKRVINWPDQHYSNGVDKNSKCGQRYKRFVRVLKKLCNEMDNSGVTIAKGIPGFLCECLMWNVPDRYFSHSNYHEAFEPVLTFLYEQLGSDASNEWREVSELKYLFGSSQKWTKQQTREFILSAWRYIGY